MDRPRLLFQILCFGSGLSALVFEIVWLRGFAVILGGTVFSMSCVLTAFMLGLSLGGLLAARRLRVRNGLTRRSALIVYGWLEGGIGLYGLVFSPTLFTRQTEWLSLVAGLEQGAENWIFGSHFLISLGALLIPTVCMGASLPVLCLALSHSRHTAGLYAANTFGAALGSLLASFLLIYLFGCLTTIVIASSLNGLIWLVALGVARGLPPAPKLKPNPGCADEDSQPAGLAARVVLPLACFSGYAFFSMELVWNRALGLVLGNRIYVTSITLGLVLFCLGLGARLSMLLRPRLSAARLIFFGYAAAVLASAAGLALADAALREDPRSAVTLMLFVLCLILIPATGLGLGFPLLLSLPAPRSERGSRVGWISAANTLGATLGTLLTGYFALRLLGSQRVILVNLLLLALAAALLVAFDAGSGPRFRALSLALVLFAGVTGYFGWETRLTSVPGSQIVFSGEDAHGIFSVARAGEEQLRVTCNATELVFLYGHPQTQFVQETQAHIPLLYSDGSSGGSSRVAVIGSGYGITAGTFGLYADTGRVDAVEILPLMVGQAQRFSPGNHDYHTNPKIRIKVGDGRHFLALAEQPYDIISINVSDPYLPGSASLFSAEFYALVADRLAPSGIVCQHLFGPDAASLLHAFRTWFPHLAAVPAYGRSGLTVIGSQQPLELHHLKRAFTEPAPRKALSALGIDRPGQLLELLERGRVALAALLAQPAEFVNSDVHPALEFRRSDQLGLFLSNH